MKENKLEFFRAVLAVPFNVAPFTTSITFVLPVTRFAVAGPVTIKPAVETPP